MDVKDSYKKTEIGVIPEDWDVKEFGEIFKVIGGGAFKSSDSQQTGVKWLKIANVGINIIKWDEQGSLPKHLIQENKNFLLKEGDYVLALTRPILDRKLKISKLKRNDVPALLNQRVGKIEPIGDNNIDYIYFLLQQHASISSLLQSMAGTDPPNLGNKGIYAILSGIPKTKKEQKAIAKVLSDTDNLIQALEKRIAKKRLIKQGVMQKLFTPKEDAAYDKSPADRWEVKKLGEIGVFKGGNGFPVKYQGCNEGKYPFFKVSDMNNVGNLTFMNNSNNWISDIVKKENRTFVFPSKTIVFAKIGAAIFLERKKILAVDSCMDNNMMGFIIDKSKSDFRYIYYLFHKIKLGVLVSTTALPSLNGKDIAELEFGFPPKAKQTRIATILSDMDTEIETLEKKLSKYKQLKQGLMQNLLTGKIRLI